MAERVVLVRHGETAWSSARRHTGRTDIPLNDEGRRLAEGLRPVLAGLTGIEDALVLMSPLKRACDTCMLAGLGARAQVEPNLVEWDYGVAEGKRTDEMRQTIPGWSVWTHPIVGGESLEQVGHRADKVLARVAGEDRLVVLFAHAHILRILDRPLARPGRRARQRVRPRPGQRVDPRPRARDPRDRALELRHDRRPRTLHRHRLTRSPRAPPCSRYASRDERRQRQCVHDDFMTATETTTTVVVPGTHLMQALVGPRDQHLRQIERAFPDTAIQVRGNEVSARGGQAEEVGLLFEELVGLLQRGHELDEPSLSRVIGMVSAAERPSEILTQDILRGAKGRQIRPKSAGQKRYIDAIANNVITFGIGPAGTGKSWLAVAMAVKALQAKEVQRIILTRPAVEAGERLGFLPGDLMAKIDPYLRPLYDALYDMVEPEGAQRLLERQTVEVAPLAFMRGRTLNNSFIILDEAQNTTPEQMKMFLTRIGFGSRVVVTGDVTQIDVPNGKSGLVGLERVLSGIEGLAFVKLGAADVVRHRIVADIVAAYERNGESRAEMGEPPSPTAALVTVVAADEQGATDGVAVDVDRWAAVARAALAAEGAHGELTLTFVDRDEIAALNAEHLGNDGATDVLSFPLDADDDVATGRRPRAAGRRRRVPGGGRRAGRRARRHRRRRARPARRARRAPRPRARPRQPAETAAMRGRELELLQAHHWHGPAPAGFRQEHRS